MSFSTGLKVPTSFASCDIYRVRKVIKQYRSVSCQNDWSARWWLVKLIGSVNVLYNIPMSVKNKHRLKISRLQTVYAATVEQTQIRHSKYHNKFTSTSSLVKIDVPVKCGHGKGLNIYTWVIVNNTRGHVCIHI